MGLRALLRPALLVAAAAIAPLAAIAVRAQQAEPSITFQVDVDFVDIDAVVTDQRGNFVSGLAKEDFELFEDGTPQDIGAFSIVDMPLPASSAVAASRPAAMSDVKTNAQPLSGRLYVIVLDDLNVAPLRSKVVVDAARRFIEGHFGPEDVAAITYTSGRTDGAQEFTSDKRLLLAAINKFLGRKLRSSVIEKADHYFQQHVKELAANAPQDDTGAQDPPQSATVRGPIGNPNITTDPDDFERGHRAQVVLGSLRRLAEMMGGIRGRRKAILMFSEGIDYPIYDIFGSQAATNVIKATQDAIAGAARGNVSFFAVDPRGLVGMTSETIELNAAADAHLGFDARGLLADMYLSQDSLRVLAEETGGYAALNFNNVDTALRRIVRATSTYYVLGYYPKDTRRDGRFRKIEVRVRRPGLRVVARKGYVAPRALDADDLRRRARDQERARGRAGDAQTSVELREILTQPIQRNGLTLAVQAAPFASGSRQASVALAVEVDAGRLTFEKQANGTFTDGIELSLFALDERGRQHGGTFYHYNLALRPETYERVRGSIVRMNPRLALAPGRYQLRVGVRESGAGEMGTVFYDLTIPNYAADGLSMSGLLLSDQTAAAQYTPHKDDEIPAGTLASPATSRRTFRVGDLLQVFAEIYDSAPRESRQVEAVTRLMSDTGVAVYSSRESLRPAPRAEARSARAALVKQIPLNDLRPGRYTLQIEARAPGEAKPVTRETTITLAAASQQN